MPGTYAKGADPIMKYQYLGLDGNAYWVKTRMHLSGGLTQGAVPSTSDRFPGKPSHVRIRCIDGAGKVHHKNLLYDSNGSHGPNNAFAAIGASPIDGLTGWTIAGHSGEKVRG